MRTHPLYIYPIIIGIVPDNTGLLPAIGLHGVKAEPENDNSRGDAGIAGGVSLEGETPQYNSQCLDKESGFYFYNARYYDSGIGRFTSVDSVITNEGDTQSWNRYSYVLNNPIIYKDPTGNWEKEKASIQYEQSGVDREKSYYGGTVEKGDTLSGIAKQQLENEIDKKDVTNRRIAAKVNYIKDINGLKGDTIKPGQKLFVGITDRITGEKGVESKLLDDPILTTIVGGGALKGLKGAAVAQEGAKQLLLRDSSGKFVEHTTKNLLKGLSTAIEILSIWQL